MCLCTFAFLHKTKYLERKFFMQDEKKFVSTYQLTELLRKDKNIEPEHFKEQRIWNILISQKRHSLIWWM